jgi:hypothetical protein
VDGVVQGESKSKEGEPIQQHRRPPQGQNIRRLALALPTYPSSPIYKRMTITTISTRAANRPDT